MAGLRALLVRLARCRPGYHVQHEGGRFRLILADGSQLDEDEMAPHVLDPYLMALESRRAQLALSKEKD